MKLLFVYDMPLEHALHWRDGLWAALKELEKSFEITRLNLVDYDGSYIPEYDFILGWGGSTSIVAGFVKARTEKKGLCFGGGEINDPILDNFDIVFVENESQLIKPNFRHAFGTNTDLFKPVLNAKIIDALYPAAFANWKHQEIFARYCFESQLKGLAVGYIQQDNMAESQPLIDVCVRNGIAVMDWVPAQSLAWLYNASKEVVICADQYGGSERAVLEAKACGIPVKLITQVPKLLDLAELTSQEVRENWNHIEYSKQLKEGILWTKSQ